ncbi:TetR/AcrR family transcriptional regulator [Chelativorans sp. Marseille-P2723]|uniref:TetR/AcrR family transcriptional regulator n=1 Tax=Chelativorans sp. Marseille-P2723 TaxID=2709133 RepID=UPI001FF01A8B|nr:TetR/AcrR family transcriptional regulator [Chelativorans sp. Marseille-P2723]
MTKYVFLSRSEIVAAESTLIGKDEGAEDPRRGRILEGARQVFLAYGFSRATMDDIARAARISRPALYLFFRNKADIFRAVGQDMLDRSRASACIALRKEGPFGVRLMDALDVALFQLFRLVEESPHGQEIIEVENRIASDIIADWRQSLIAAFTRMIEEEAQRREKPLDGSGLSADSIARMLFDILEGLKARGLCGTHAKERADQFVKLVELALSGNSGSSR